MSKTFILLIFSVIFTTGSYAQVSISANGSLPDSSAMLDVKSNSRGILVPRMNTAQRTGIIRPAEGLLVYDLTAKSFWYFKNSAWSEIGAPGWSLTGNAGTNPAINFIGTTDNASLEFRANNMRSGFIDLARDNISLGAQSLLVINSGQQNTAIGSYALHENNGWTNTAVGYASSFNQTDGAMNTAIGGLSLLNNIHGSNNTALGQGTLSINTIGNGNVALGYNAGYYEEGNDRLYIDNRLRSDLPQSRKRALIYGVFDDDPANQSLTINAKVGIGTTDPNASAALEINSNLRGFLPPRMNSTQMNAIPAPALGLLVYNIDNDALYHFNGTTWSKVAGSAGNMLEDTDGDTRVEVEQTPDDDTIRFSTGGTEYFNMASGRLGISNTGNSIFIGNGSGSTDDMNNRQNVFIGNNAGNHNTQGGSNVAIGTGALNSNYSYSNLVAIGDSALYKNVSGIYNTAIGSKALYANTTGSYNTANGYHALYSNTTGNNNTANGYNALDSNTAGIENTAYGNAALRANSTGYANSANGTNSLYSNTTGFGNTASGGSALFLNVTGNNNTAVGLRANYYTTSDNNTSVGVSAGDYYTFTNGTFLGSYAYPSAPGYSNCMALGYDAHVDASNKVVVGNTSVTSIGGYAGWTNFSDGRFKKNVKENVPGLDFISQLHPITYSLDITSINADIDRKRSAEANGEIKMPERSASDLENIKAKEKIVYTGFIAQDVEAAAKSIGYDFSGVDAPQDPDGHYGLRYAEFVVPLVKAVQEQQAIIDNQQKQIDELMKRIEALEGKK